jgi:hypothetical protein
MPNTAPSSKYPHLITRFLPLKSPKFSDHFLGCGGDSSKNKLNTNSYTTNLTFMRGLPNEGNNANNSSSFLSSSIKKGTKNNMVVPLTIGSGGFYDHHTLPFQLKRLNTVDPQKYFNHLKEISGVSREQRMSEQHNNSFKNNNFGGNLSMIKPISEEE